jgi:hypothetical protein
MSRRTLGVAVGLSIGLLALGTVPSATAAPEKARAKHVLLLSVDGLHETDLAYYVANHPHSALAALVSNGTNYTNARTTFPSDSFPGMVAQLTGGEPGTTGVFYDDTYNHQLIPPGTVDSTTAARGTEVAWTEAADRSQSPITLDAGQKLTDAALTGLSTNTLAKTLANSDAITQAILKMTPTPQALLDPASLPGRSRNLPSDLPAQLPQGEHGLRTGAGAWPAHRLVRQAPGVRNPERTVRNRCSGPFHARDQQRRGCDG